MCSGRLSERFSNLPYCWRVEDFIGSTLDNGFAGKYCISGRNVAAGKGGGMKHIFLFFALCAASALWAETKPLRICVLDFTTADIIGQERFLNVESRMIEIPVPESLNTADRLSINRRMQGFVRMIDAYSVSEVNSANIDLQLEDRQIEWAKALELYNTVMKGEARPVVLGSEYLAGYLGSRGDLFRIVDTSLMYAAMEKLQSQPDFPKDFLRRLAAETGATHLVCGTVSDLTSRGKAFKGYGIETQTTEYRLDVILKVVDLEQQSTVLSNVYTGSWSVQQRPAAAEFDNNIFQSLMKSALEQAAEEMAEKFSSVPETKEGEQ